MSTSSSCMVLEPESAIDDPAPVAPGSQRVHDSIRYLLAKEYHGLATHHREPYLGIIPWTVFRYFKFILKIWVGVASSSFRMLTRRISQDHLLFTPVAFDTDICPPIKAYTASMNSTLSLFSSLSSSLWASSSVFRPRSPSSAVRSSGTCPSSISVSLYPILFLHRCPDDIVQSTMRCLAN